MIGNFVAITGNQLATLRADPDSVAEFLYPGDGDDEVPNHLDIDKTWHAIHFLLNGKTWEGAEPWFLVILGGTPIGEDVGYGPARYLEPEQVREVADALSTVDAAELARRFDPKAMEEADIYPSIWEQDQAEGLEYIQQYYPLLVKFYADAASRGDAAILFVN
jgi:hypothetical protein